MHHNSVDMQLICVAYENNYIYCQQQKCVCEYEQVACQHSYVADWHSWLSCQHDLSCMWS